MAYTFDNPQLYFQSVVYSGTSTSTAVTLPGTEDMQPDAVWTKSTSNAETHCLYDSVRGTGKRLRPDDVAAENDEGSNGVSAFNSDGFTTGEQGGSGQNGLSYVAWCWKESATSGLDVVLYTGNATNRTISHNLSAVPKCMWVKGRGNGTQWNIYHASLGANKHLNFDSNEVAQSYTNRFNDTDPTSSVFTVGTDAETNTSGGTMVAYCFAEKKGFSKFAKWIGNANANGPYIHCGFTPAVIFYKNSGGTDNWIMKTKIRQVNPNNYYVKTDENAAEVTSNTISAIDFLSNGFKVRATDSATNGSDATYVFMAFAESPLVNSNGVPATAV